jgi:hypothetical protein
MSGCDWIDEVIITSYIVASVVDSHSVDFKELVAQYVNHVRSASEKLP